MSVTFRHLASGSSLCARRRWLYNNIHTVVSSSFGREQLDTSNRSNFIEKPSTPKKGIKRKVTAPSVVENNRIRQHLDHIESTKDDLALEDVERYKPHGMLDFMQPTYDQKYQEIQNALTQSFTKPQLRRFLKLYGLPSIPNSKGKIIFAEILMKQWGLEPLAKVQEERADWRENSELLYPMSPAYAFLFMGKDGVDLLNLAKRYSIHLSFISDPLRLRIQGLRGAVKQLDGYLKNFEGDITSETARMPHGLTISLGAAQSISRFSGAYAEVSDDGKLLITYRKSDSASAIRVKRLAVQAASKQLDFFENRIHVLGESSGIVPKSIEGPEPCHSFYPFFSPQMPLREVPSSSAFRLRRVGHWLRAGARYNMDGEEISNVPLDKESIYGIKTRLLDELSTHCPPNSKMVVTATPGHILFLAPSEQAFKPPISGNVKESVVFKWAKENPSQALFNPCVPKSLMTSWPHMQGQFQRIVYTALPIKSEITQENSLRKTLVLETLPRSVDAHPEDLNASKPSQTICCQRSIETHADILLPSRAMDIRISISQVETISSSDIPKELQSFTKELNLVTEPVNPPLTLTLDGVHYILSAASHIRRDHRHSSKSPKEISYDLVIETTINPEAGQQLMVCKVPCSNPSSDWHEFFTHCDHITMMDSKPSEHLLSMIQPWFQDSDINANVGTQTENEGNIESLDDGGSNLDEWHSLQ